MKLRVGVVGLGYWGPNYVRNFISSPQSEVIWVCDLLDKNLKKIQSFAPQVKITKDFNQLLKDKNVDCVAIATPPKSHYNLAKLALMANKHVFIAKPITTSSKDLLDLIQLAKKKRKILFGDLTFLYYPPVVKIKKLIDNNSIGEPIYYDSTRINLGLIQKDVNVIWDLVIHDFSIIDYCFGYKPKQVFAIASKHVNSIREEIARVTLTYSNNFTSHISVSWISPVKIRKILIGGTKKMIVFDDIDPDEKIKIYNKGVIFPEEWEKSVFNPVYRSGDILVPKISNKEALTLEIKDFVKHALSNTISFENANRNLSVIKILEHCDLSLNKGKPVSFK